MQQAWDRLRGVDGRHPRILDTTLAVLLLAGALLSAGSTPHARPLDGLAVALMTLGAVPYCWRRRFPVAAFFVAFPPVIVLIAQDYSSAVLGSGLFLLAYTIASLRSARTTGMVVACTAAVLIGLTLAFPQAIPLAELATNAALFAGAFAVGNSTRVRRVNAELVEERARLASLARRDEVARAVSEERLHIAQELHDILGHSMGVIALQAGVGAHVIDVDPDEAKASLDAIATTSRTALVDIRRVLSAIRSDDETPLERPVPGLADVDELVAGFTAGGMRIKVDRSQAEQPVPAALDRTAYRLIQEALTNVLKHAGPCSTELTIATTPRDLTLSIVNSGSGAPTTPTTEAGHGQLGMRERVAVWNGTFDVGPRPGGGYSVRAWLPFSQEDLA